MFDDELDKEEFDNNEDSMSEKIKNDEYKEEESGEFSEDLEEDDVCNDYVEDLSDGEVLENENNFDNLNIECDRNVKFDYRRYMSEPKDIEYDDMNKENDRFDSFDSADEKKNNGILRTVVVAFCTSFFVCVLFAVGIVLGTRDSRAVTTSQTEGFPMYRNKNVTIETKSDELIVEIAEKVGPSVVGIKTTVLTRDFLFGLTESNPSGSGVIFKEEGYILTNNHVIENALVSGTNNVAKGCKIEVILPSKKEEVYEAKVVGRDTKTDLAVLKIEKVGLNAAVFGDSDKLKVGEIAVAIGNPGGLEYMGSVTSGIISGLNRTLALENGRQLKLVQTDAAINPGNSGGALVNAKGEVIGINTVKIAGSEYEGLGFAIPSNKVKEICESLVEYKYVKGRPLIGITIDTRYDESVAKRNDMPIGVYVAGVDLLSPAYKAGIERGDIITEFAGIKINNIDQLNEEKNKHKAGDEVKVKIYKSTTKKTITIKIKLGEDVGTIS